MTQVVGIGVGLPRTGASVVRPRRTDGRDLFGFVLRLSVDGFLDLVDLVEGGARLLRGKVGQRARLGRIPPRQCGIAGGRLQESPYRDLGSALESERIRSPVAELYPVVQLHVILLI